MSVETINPDQTIQVSEAAAKHFQNQLTQLGGCGVRFSVKNSGCSGLAYVIDCIDTPVEGDVDIELSNGVHVFVDAEAVAVLRGMEIDFVREGLNNNLKLNNPNVKAACGCGESFSI
ncbi:MAG: iron-sulfur cluster assembly accessory protein [Pseudomonadales bacterium]